MPLSNWYLKIFSKFRKGVDAQRYKYETKDLSCYDCETLKLLSLLCWEIVFVEIYRRKSTRTRLILFFDFLFFWCVNISQHIKLWPGKISFQFYFLSPLSQVSKSRIIRYRNMRKSIFKIIINKLLSSWQHIYFAKANNNWINYFAFE